MSKMWGKKHSNKPWTLCYQHTMTEEVRPEGPGAAAYRQWACTYVWSGVMWLVSVAIWTNEARGCGRGGGSPTIDSLFTRTARIKMYKFPPVSPENSNWMKTSTWCDLSLKICYFCKIPWIRRIDLIFKTKKNICNSVLFFKDPLPIFKTTKERFLLFFCHILVYRSGVINLFWAESYFKRIKLPEKIR